MLDIFDLNGRVENWFPASVEQLNAAGSEALYLSLEMHRKCLKH